MTAPRVQLQLEPKLLPLVEAIEARYDSLTVDAKLVNAIAEKSESEGAAYIYRRPGFVAVHTLAVGTARGMTNWQGNIYCVINDTVYKNTAALTGTVTNSGTYTFTACLGAAPVLFLQNGADSYTITEADVLAAVVDADYPATTVGGAVFLDGTVYVMDEDSNIVGSLAAGNDPTSWDPLNVIVAQIEPTRAVFLAKQLVYVLALKQSYTEAFYDRGNPTGSPLAPVQGAKMNYGCVDAGTVKDVGGDLMWVANSGEGGYCVVMVSGLKLEVVSTPPIERLLSSATIGSFYSWNLKISGHRLYGVTNTTANYTLVFDLTSRLWYQWETAAGNYLPYAFSCQGTNSDVHFLHASTGVIYKLSLASAIDENDSAFPCIVYTPNFDASTRRLKTLTRLAILGDQIATTVSIAYSDDDYATWSTDQTVSMAEAQPFISNLGSFARRAFRITHQDNNRFRLKAAEMYIDVGPA